MSSIPDGFEPEFLDWFRARTEAAWANIPEATPEETLAKYVNWGVGGLLVAARYKVAQWAE